jgi:hypothetical protein
VVTSAAGPLDCSTSSSAPASASRNGRLKRFSPACEIGARPEGQDQVVVRQVVRVGVEPVRDGDAAVV